MSIVKVRPGDTLQTIAKRYKQDLETLRSLNPVIDLTPGGTLNIHYDLTS